MAAHCPECNQQLDRQTLRQGFRWSALQQVQINCPSYKTTLEITPRSVSLIAVACCLLAVITIPGMSYLHQSGLPLFVVAVIPPLLIILCMPILYVLLSRFHVKQELSIR